MKNIIIVCSCLLLLSCSKESISVKQTKSNFPVILMMDSSTNKVDFVLFDLCYEIKKNRLSKMWVGFTDYAYPVKEYGYKEANSLGYIYRNDTLEYLNRNYYDRRYLRCFTSDQYVVKIGKPVDTALEIQNMFQPYIDKMLQQGKDTLHIESIQQLKKSNPELINNLLTGDLMRIGFVKNDKSYSSIFPVEVK